MSNNHFSLTTHKTNRDIAMTMAGCSLIVVALMVLKELHVFDFEGLLGILISVVGFTTTLTPLILYLCKVPDGFLKYYSLIAMALFIGTLGCFNNIGIYITFVLVPITSCLYFDTKVTVFFFIFSYLVMVAAVFVNSAGKLEVKYMDWTHLEAFRAYIIGFTLEYAAVIAFLAQVLRRYRGFIEAEHTAYIKQQAQEARYELLMKATSDIIFEFNPRTQHYKANRSLYQRSDVATNTEIEIHSLEEIEENVPGLYQMLLRVTEEYENVLSSNYEIDLSYEENGKLVPLWFQVECFVVKDHEKAVGVIGKMHNITRMKLDQNSQRREHLESLFNEDKMKNSIYRQAAKEARNFTDEDYAKLAEGHRFIAMMLESVKYTEDLVDSIHDMLSQIGNFFEMDRVCVMETDVSSGTTEISYQWNSKPLYEIQNTFPDLTQAEVRTSIAAYDEMGYFEVNPSLKEPQPVLHKLSFMQRTAEDMLIGNQLWIPMMANGRFIGAICFDRADKTKYKATEKLLLSEVVNTLTAHILKINAENSNKAKSDFLSTMSHEIRTPMNAIVGMTEVALREDMSESVKKNLKMVQSSAFGLLTLINDILDYSKIEAGRFDIVPENFSLLSVLNDVKEMANARNKGKLELVYRIPNDLPAKLYGDAVRIKQVMVNYCTNAIKYSDEGKVEIRVMVRRESDTQGTLYFAVKDNGIGIKKEDLPKLFKTYTRVDTTVNHHKEGTGLGLAICKQLVELMGGFVSVESEYGKGSTFAFEIPLQIVDGSEAGTLENYHMEDAEPKKKEEAILAPTAKVLIVDDTSINLMVAKALLGPTKIQVETVDSGEGALELLKQNAYDLVFMDHFMPGMDGVETTAHIRAFEDEKVRNLPIIALTADAMEGVREELLSKGMNDFLTKPIMIGDMYQVLRTWLPASKIEN